MANLDLSDLERARAEARAALGVVEAEYRTANRTLLALADRLSAAKEAAAKANGKLHLARMREMLWGVE